MHFLLICVKTRLPKNLLEAEQSVFFKFTTGMGKSLKIRNEREWETDKL